MFVSFAKQNIIRIRPGVKVERGSEIPDWSAASRLTVSGCSVQPASTSLTQGDRVGAVSDGMTCYAPINADIKVGDRIEYDGAVYAITGEPRKWFSPSGNLDHLIIDLTRWFG